MIFIRNKLLKLFSLGICLIGCMESVPVDSYGVAKEFNTYDHIITDNCVTAESKETETSWIDLDGMGMAGVAIAVGQKTDTQSTTEEPQMVEVMPKYNFSEEEFDYFCRCVQAEAGGESAECKRAVAETILNRLDSDRYPNTITDVINAKNQFEVVNNGSILKVFVSEETRAVCQNAITQDRIHPQNMFYFRDSRYHKYKNTDCYTVIDNMYFSLLKGA